jgi:hypothetical protein
MLRWSRARCFAIASLALFCAALLAGCERKVGATIEKGTNPPVFRLLGNGCQTKLVIYGPHPDRHDLQMNFATPAIWSIATAGAAMLTPSEKLPLVEYARPPAEFENYGTSTPPPALEPGKYYKMVVSATHGDTFYKNGRPHERFELTDVCFLFEASGATEVPCKEK